MLVVIKYRAKLTYASQSEVHTDELCDVVHTIDTETLQTLDADFSNRRVAETTIGDFWISTVFLSIDHNYSSSGPPILFETMVQNNKTDKWTGPDGEEIQERCSTWDEALTQHERVVEEVKKQIEQIK